MALFIGIIVGFVLALPPGGVAVVGVHRSLKLGWRRAAPYAVGSMIADITYACGAVLAADAVSGAVTSVTGRYPAIVVVTKGLVVALLIVGGLAIVARRSPVKLTPEGPEAEDHRARGPFLLGLALNFTNAFVSPSFLAALAIVIAEAGAFGILDGNRLSYVAYGVGFGLGNLLYMLLLMWLAVVVAKRLRDRQVLIAQRILGLALAGTGAVLGANLVAGLGA